MRKIKVKDKDDLGPKAQAFVSALRVLCKAHDVMLSTSGYDGLQVWSLQGKDDPIFCPSIQDCCEP